MRLEHFHQYWYIIRYLNHSEILASMFEICQKVKLDKLSKVKLGVGNVLRMRSNKWLEICQKVKLDELSKLS